MQPIFIDADDDEQLVALARGLRRLGHTGLSDLTESLKRFRAQRTMLELYTSLKQLDPEELATLPLTPTADDRE